MYGITALGNSPYAVYLSDMEMVWFTSPTKKEVCDKASAQGISDFDESKLAFFVGELVKMFGAQSPSLKFFRQSNVLFTIETQVAQNIPWHFELRLADSSETASFFRNVCVSTFANHNFLLYKISQLEHLIKARDKYIVYLEENYKTINGMELMEKYKRQHVEDARLLVNYDKDSTNLRIRTLYRNYLKRQTEWNPENRLWDNLKVALKDKSTWRANMDESPDLPVDTKFEEKSPYQTQSQTQAQDSKIRLGEIPRLDSQKRSELSSSPVRSQPSSSPTKRRRVGSGRR